MRADRSPQPIQLTAFAVAVVLLVGACDGAVAPGMPDATQFAPGASPSAHALPPATGRPATPAPTPAATAEPTPATTAEPAPPPSSEGVLVPGALAVTVADRVRVRSEPRVAGSSTMHTPLLPLGTELVVVAGPVRGSNYTWYKVAPTSIRLDHDVDQGWVAVADHDGTPWVALAQDPTPGFELASVTTPRPKGTLAEARAAADAQNAFGIALYKRLLKDPRLGIGRKGIVLSPTSIVLALGMARAGARAETAAEMDAVLGRRGWDRLGAGLNALDQRLRSRDATWKDYPNDEPHEVALQMANQAFGQDGYPLRTAYLERLAATFGSPLALVDYINDPDGARQAINGWVRRQTMGRIPDLLEPPQVTDLTRLVLVNAMYLKAEWARQFADYDTSPRSFTTLGGETVKVPTMRQYGGQEIPLAAGDGWRATELEYAAPEGQPHLSMTLILPDDIRTFGRSFTTDMLADIDRELDRQRRRLQRETPPSNVEGCGAYPYEVRLFLPRFGLDTRASLNDALQVMGMRDAFNMFTADFSGMTAADRLYIKFVIHQANIDVNEAGTIAAAATAVGVDVGGCTGPVPRVVKDLRFNRPFLFLLRDTQTGAILFFGRVTDPTTR